jgi:hypothetical protein
MDVPVILRAVLVTAMTAAMGAAYDGDRHFNREARARAKAERTADKEWRKTERNADQEWRKAESKRLQAERKADSEWHKAERKAQRAGEKAWRKYDRWR